MRPPLRSMLPPSRGVSIGMRGDEAMTASREAACVWADVASVFGVPGTYGVAGWAAFGCGVADCVAPG